MPVANSVCSQVNAGAGFSSGSARAATISPCDWRARRRKFFFWFLLADAVIAAAVIFYLYYLPH